MAPPAPERNGQAIHIRLVSRQKDDLPRAPHLCIKCQPWHSSVAPHRGGEGGLERERKVPEAVTPTPPTGLVSWPGVLRPRRSRVPRGPGVCLCEHLSLQVWKRPSWGVREVTIFRLMNSHPKKRDPSGLLLLAYLPWGVPIFPATSTPEKQTPSGLGGLHMPGLPTQGDRS